MDKKHWLVALITFLVFLFIMSVIISENILDKEPENIVQALRQDFLICEILENEGNDYWLECNGRPFFASFENNEASYRMNGWSFLEQDDLNIDNCEFYKSKKITGGIELVFYCNMNSPSPAAKIAIFDTKTLKTKQIGEVDLLQMLLDDLKSSYTSLENCKPSGIQNVILEYMHLKEINLDCEGEKKSIYIQSQINRIFPSLESKKDDTGFERSKDIFNNLFGDICLIKSVEKGESRYVVGSECKSLPFDITAEYYISNRTYASKYRVIQKTPNTEEYIIKNLINRFVLNIEPSEDFEILGRFDADYPEKAVVKVYRISDNVVRFFESEGEIVLIDELCDKMVC